MYKKNNNTTVSGKTEENPNNTTGNIHKNNAISLSSADLNKKKG